jgi:hypothetical protein
VARQELIAWVLVMAATAALGSAIGSPARRVSNAFESVEEDASSGPEGLLIVAEMRLSDGERSSDQNCYWAHPASLSLQLTQEDQPGLCCANLDHQEDECGHRSGAECSFLAREKRFGPGHGDASPPAATALRVAPCPKKGRYRVDVRIASVHLLGPYPPGPANCPQEPPFQPPTVEIIGNCPGLTIAPEERPPERHAVCDARDTNEGSSDENCNAMWVYRKFSLGVER